MAIDQSISYTPSAMNSSTFKTLLFFLLCVCAFELQAQKSGGKVSKPKNVILVTIDTLRADHLATNGYFRDAAPFLNTIATKGVNFRQAYTCSSHTAPSHASMFTSLYPFEHRVRRNLEALHHSIPSVASFMKEKGYTVAGFSAVNFLEGRVGFPNLSSEYRWKDTAITKKFWYRNAEQNVTRVKRWLETKEASEKFFLWIHFYDVHEWMKRFHMPKEFLTHFDGQDGEEMRKAVEEHHGPAAEHFKKPERFFNAINRYDARLRYVDSHLADLYEFMNKRAMNDNSLWIVTSDHGEGLNNHSYLYHGEYLYQEQLRVPLFFHFTDFKVKRQVSDLVRTIDLFPTIAALIGHPLRFPVRGESLVPLLNEGRWEGERKVRFSMAERRPRDDTRWHRGWKKGEVLSLHDLKNKVVFHSAFEDEFYNFKADPYELKSAPPNQDHQALLSQLKSIASGVLNEKPAPQLPKYDKDAVEELSALGYL